MRLGRGGGEVEFLSFVDFLGLGKMRPRDFLTFVFEKDVVGLTKKNVLKVGKALEKSSRKKNCVNKTHRLPPPRPGGRGGEGGFLSFLLSNYFGLMRRLYSHTSGLSLTHLNIEKT